MADKIARKKKRRIQTIITYSVFGTLILMLALYLIFRNTNRIQYELPTVATVNAEEIKTIRIVSERNGIVEVRRSGETWTVGSEAYPINDTHLNDMLEAIEDFSLSELVSTAEYYERYELDDENKFELLISGDKDTLLRFDIGKRSPSYNHTYIRLSGDDRVFQAQGNLRSTFDKDIDALRDKLVFSIDPANVMSVGVTANDDSYRVYRTVEDDTSVWNSDDETEWDAEAISSALDRLAKLECQAFLDDEEIQELGSPSFVLEVQEENSHQLYFYDETDSSYRARSSQSPYAFTLSSYSAKQIREAFDRSFSEDE